METIEGRKKAQKTVKKGTANPENGSKGQLYSGYIYVYMHLLYVLLEKKPAYILPLDLPVSQVNIVVNQVSILLVVTLSVCLMQIFGV